MPEAPIRKIQILTNRETGLPLFYCHSDDVGHEPKLAIEKAGGMVLLRAQRLLYKVKYNPQRKDRVDIYMSIDQANFLGAALLTVADVPSPLAWRQSTAKPHAAASGNMQLPDIIWSKFAKYTRAVATVDSGVSMASNSGYINIDLETPHETHIKMKEREIHIGITLGNPTGTHDLNKTFPVEVPEHELQKGRSEKNPIYKVHGDFELELPANLAGGLGLLLRDEVRAE